MSGERAPWGSRRVVVILNEDVWASVCAALVEWGQGQGLDVVSKSAWTPRQERVAKAVNSIREARDYAKGEANARKAV